METLKSNVNCFSLNSNTEGIKILGERYLRSDIQINCDWTCSGIEFVIDHKGGDIVFDVSHLAGNAYFRAYIDGVECRNEDNSVYFDTPSEVGKIHLKDIAEGEHTVRLIKATGYILSRSQITTVSFAGTILADKKPANKDLYIEWVGDSISCGWGTIGTYDGKYTSQDGTLAYPWIISQELDADYAVTAASGNGIAGGFFPVGYEYASYWRDRTPAGKYEFQRKADLVVVNIGTNDVKMDASAFRQGYLALIKSIKENNGANCKILCLYNTMNDTHQDQILSVCEELSQTYSDIFSLKLNRTAKVYTGHPTAEENQAYAEFILNYLRNTVLI